MTRPRPIEDDARMPDAPELLTPIDVLNLLRDWSRTEPMRSLAPPHLDGRCAIEVWGKVYVLHGLNYVREDLLDEPVT